MSTIIFRELVTDVHDYTYFDKSPQHMVSRIEFTLKEGIVAHEMEVEVRQPWGGDFMTQPLDVGAPLGDYDGPWDQNEFCGLVGLYYRRWLRDADAGVVDSEKAYTKPWKTELHVTAAA